MPLRFVRLLCIYCHAFESLSSKPRIIPITISHGLWHSPIFLSMFKSVILTRILVFATSVLAFSIPSPTLLSGNITTAGNILDHPAGNFSASSKNIRCSSHNYGTNPSLDSCKNAWAKMPRTEGTNLYTSRSYTGTSTPLPLRWQSDDGLCVIDLRAKLKDHAIRDMARTVDISNAAQYIIDQCIMKSKTRTGGSTYGFSMLYVPVNVLSRKTLYLLLDVLLQSNYHLIRSQFTLQLDQNPRNTDIRVLAGLTNQLAVSVAKYESKAICINYPRGIISVDACADLLQEMPAGTHSDDFVGPEDEPSITSYSRLPKSYERGEPKVNISAGWRLRPS